MKKRKFQLSLLALLFITSICISPFLQPSLVSLWRFDGLADGENSKYELLFLMPLIASILYSMSIPFEKALLKKSERSKKFIGFMQIYLIIVLGSIHIYNILNVFNYSISIYSILSILTSIAFFYVGYSIKYIELNKFSNSKVKWILDNYEIFHKISVMASNMLYSCGVLMMLGLKFPEYFYFILIVPLTINTIIFIYYTYYLYKKYKKNNDF